MDQNLMSFETLDEQAQAAFAQGNAVEALQFWEDARRLFPENILGWLRPAKMLMERRSHNDEGSHAGIEALLLEAAERFPNDVATYHQLAQLAERKGEWATAEKWWRKSIPLKIDLWWVHTSLAAAIAAQSRTAAAEAVLVEAQGYMPHEPALFQEHARLAQLQGNWEEAIKRWTEFRKRFPDTWAGFEGYAETLKRLGRTEEAHAVLRDAAERFPNQISVRHDLARLAETTGDWATAEKWWREFLAANTGIWWAHTSLALSLKEQGQLDDARAFLREAQKRFPREATIFAERATLEISALQWRAVESICNEMQRKFPLDPRGYTIASQALQRQGRTSDAQQVLSKGLKKTNRSFNVLLDLAFFLGRDDIGERSKAISYLEEARVRYPEQELGYAVSVRLLKNAGRANEARALASEAARRFPLNYELSCEYARFAEDENDISERLKWYTTLRQDRADAPTGFVGLAITLNKAGRADEADAVLNEAITRFPSNLDVLSEAANLSEQRGDWASAVRKWQELKRRAPSDKQIQHRLYVSELRLAETDTSPSSADLPVVFQPAIANRDLVMSFESLGGMGGGCEFGLFQREFGAEPLGILRWTTISPKQLIDGLNANFEGIGLPENTVLLPEEVDDIRREYVTIDRNYGMRMHTFVHTNEAERKKFYFQICKRLQFLRRKLLEDLKSGSKIFVYKIVDRNLTDGELDELHAAMRTYGDNTLLYVRYTDEKHADGTVEKLRPGLLVGYVDHFQTSPSGEVGPAITDSWLAICNAAYRHWHSNMQTKKVQGPRHFVGIGHSNLHALTWAWRELETTQPNTARYTPLCIIDAPYSPAFTDEGGVKKLNAALEADLRKILSDSEDVSIFMVLGGSEAFRWSLTPGPFPFDFIDPYHDDGAPLAGQLIPYDLVMKFAKESLRFIKDLVELLRGVTKLPLVQIMGPPPPPDLPEMIAQLPDWLPRVSDYGVSLLPFRMKMWRMASRAMQEVCSEVGIGFIGCPPAALGPNGGLRDEMVGDIVHANIIWGRLQVRALMNEIQSQKDAA